MPDQVPKPVVQERYERLIAVQEEISWAQARTLVGREVEVLVSAADGRKDGATGRVSGRARDGRLVHVQGAAEPRRPGHCPRSPTPRRTTWSPTAASPDTGRGGVPATGRPARRRRGRCSASAGAPDRAGS